MSMARQDSFEAADGVRIHYRAWLPQQSGPQASGAVRAVVQIIHGAAEHGGRYERFAHTLNARGYAAYATDHRGHGLTRVGSGALGDAGPDGWNRMVADEQELSRRLRAAHSGVPLVLFGHSLGSFMVQDYITREADLADAVILSGTAYGAAPAQDVLDALQAEAEKAQLAASTFWAGRFASFNQPFGEATGFEWLSRDAQEVRKYSGDPLCGFVFSNALVRDYLHGMAALRDPQREARIPVDLPVLIVQGEHDPVGANLEATGALLQRYRELGLRHVSHHFYDGARHELLNETNRAEVEADVLAWLERTLAAAGNRP